MDFSYIPGRPVLRDVSFSASPNQVIALVGSSGSGKSTITSLICAFHNPDSGRVLVDGIDLSRIRLADYRKKLGVVFQETFLFHGSIKENVAFARPGALEEEIFQVCRTAHVDEFVEQLPHGYDTIVGERGVTLSGGQKQRIAIARALLADPRILILDEATSSLDSESEQVVQSGLSTLTPSTAAGVSNPEGFPVPLPHNKTRPQGAARSTRSRETAETCRGNSVWWWGDRVAISRCAAEAGPWFAESTDKIVQLLGFCG